MQRNWWPIVIVLVLGVVFTGMSWPIAAQTSDGKAADALAHIERRLERIEKMLSQHHSERKETHHAKGVWHRLEGVSDKDPYIVILNSETGRVRFLDLKTANVYEK